MRASVYQRKSDGRWVGSISCGKKPDGTRNRIPPVYGWSQEEVEEKTNTILYELQTNQYVPQSKDTLIDFLKDYHKICAGYDIWDSNAIPPKKAKWEVTTSQLYRMYIDVHFEPYFKTVKLKDIRAITLDEFYNFKLSATRNHSVKQGKKIVTKKVPPLSMNSVIKLHKFLEAAFNYAITNEKLKNNPTDGVKVLSSPKKYKPNVYDKEKYLKLLEAVHGKDEEVPIILGAGCGFRRGEICGLTWGNVDFDDKTITIEKTNVRFVNDLQKKPKSEKSERKIIVSAYVISTLEAYYKRKGKPKLNEKIITRWKPQSLSGMFSDLLEKYKLEHIRLHDLRHYNAVVMLNEGVNDKVAAERLGHANVTTLREVYQHVLKEADEEAADKINDSIIPSLPDSNPDKPLSKEERRKLFKVV